MLFFPHLLCSIGLVYGKTISSGKQHGGLYYMPLLQRTPTIIKLHMISIYGICILDFHRLKLTSSLLSSNNVLMTIIALFVPWQNKQEFHFYWVPFPLMLHLIYYIKIFEVLTEYPHTQGHDFSLPSSMTLQDAHRYFLYNTSQKCWWRTYLSLP